MSCQGLAIANMIKVNDTKKKIHAFHLKRTNYLHYLPTPISIGNSQIPIKQCVKNFGLTLRCRVSLNEHISIIARTC